MAFRVLCNASGKNAKQISDILARFASTGSGSNIGFIGLGNMGGHMANNLMKQVTENLQPDTLVKHLIRKGKG